MSNSGPSASPLMTRYVVQSSDVLDHLVIDVKEEGSDKVLWFKERFLDDEEIVERLVHKESGLIRWTMHRPRSGWYIRIRSPTFPPGVYIPLTPAPPAGAHPPGSLLFSSRTNAFIPNTPSLMHSYPPPPTSPPGQENGRILIETITQFVLTPHQLDGNKSEELSFFHKALNTIRKNSAGPDYSFTLRRIAPISTTSQAPPPTTTVTSEAPSPLVTFTDRTPTMTVHAITGLLIVSQFEEQMLGIESSFWIAVALTYLEFLQEKESYLAALSD
ncbi:hypothetical protein MIND_00941000 [Mycena indigotica]|uniref:Uncharacterized protein n=1 Tax=Mycena indigotica TaxID=2126181 RepID=A0A8H6SCL5_9AGAR|nr:uncharacterized protein MIND_00941000 [Mycena indigotica]KAF7297081.1 hypothetical protein MIND_00941000 [Mycena indigotica]